MAASRSSLIRARPSTRARCTAAGAVTTRVASQRALAAGLEEERHVEDREPAAPALAGREEAPLARADEGVEDRLQRGQRVRIREDLGAERSPVDRALGACVRPGIGKAREHRRHGGPAGPEQTVDRRIGVVNPCAASPERTGHGRLAHADRAGEPKDDHRPTPRQSPSAAKARSAAVASASAPNQAAKPGRAWWINMPRPSTAALPRARAVRSSAVSSGA